MRAKLMAVMLAVTLAGCATRPMEVVEVPKAVLPPAEYLKECVAEHVEVRTNGDLVRKVKGLEYALKLCNADKAAIRAWAASIEDATARGVLLDMADKQPELKLRGPL